MLDSLEDFFVARFFVAMAGEHRQLLSDVDDEYELSGDLAMKLALTKMTKSWELKE